MDNLAGMQVFVAVVDAKSFTAAAERLRVSKAAVSKQVARLEDHLGARLLNRTTRQISLTEVGQAFYDRARRILAEAQEAVEAVGRLQGEPRGQLRVNAPMNFGILYIAPLAAAFARRFPLVNLDVDFDDRYVDLVEEGYDVAIRIGQLQDSRLIAKRLAPVRRLLVASPTYLAKHGRPTSISDLANHACLTYSLQRSGDAWPFVMSDGRIRTIAVPARVRANNSHTLRASVLEDLGITLLPIFAVAEDLATGAMEEIQLDGVPTSIAVHAVYPHSRLLSTKVRLFIEELAAAFADPAPWEGSGR
ncbi:LysR substrate-binding domain-containing protein [Lacibacterium aquatile]|uniref:LysR substrate-binding domain-containing protein n=1 Tax=Lacibacterium aquatile TaxID=1168082 RepID=A0ABW5DUK8_9PROT